MAVVVRNKSASAVAALYTEYHHFVPPGWQPAERRKAVEAYLKRDFAKGVKTVATNRTELQLLGNVAVQYGTYKLEGFRGSETESFVYIWKNIAHKWYIHVDCFNIISAAKQ
uniref:DUF4440 domain-containing protein n=1 Tax=Trichuris muris TaxID=70415 RepID=A0A5S6QZG1_TRIMR